MHTGRLGARCRPAKVRPAIMSGWALAGAAVYPGLLLLLSVLRCAETSVLSRLVVSSLLSCGSGFVLVLFVLLFAVVALMVAWILFASLHDPAFPLCDGVICVLASLEFSECRQLFSLGLVDVAPRAWSPTCFVFC
jgi:hypothetical protein